MFSTWPKGYKILFFIYELAFFLKQDTSVPFHEVENTRVIST